MSRHTPAFGPVQLRHLLAQGADPRFGLAVGEAGIGGDGRPQRCSLCHQPGEAHAGRHLWRGIGRWRSLAARHRGAGVDGPGDAPGLGPGPPQIVHRLVEGVGHGVDRRGLLGPAHLHVGQLPAAPVLEGMGPLHGGALGAVDGQRAAMGQVGGVEVGSGQALSAPVVVHGGQQLMASDIDRPHRPAL